MSDPITINVKGSNDHKYSISIKVSETVEDLKNKIAEQSETPAARMRLIYSGRVLKDADTLETYKIAEGHTVHMVRSAAPAAAAPAAASGTTAAATPVSTTASTAAPTPAVPTPAPAADAFGGAEFNPWADPMGGFGGMG
ncbi:hypothetical protein BGW38_004004, partial [Lunasporangiospora selenospora]